MYIEYIEDEDYNNNCLCGKPLKHQFYYLNKNTNKIICSGESCKQKLKKVRHYQSHSQS